MIPNAAMNAVVALADTQALTPVNPVVIVVTVLIAAALCFALGTFRGSWRAWLLGYALAVAALVLAYGGVRGERRRAAATSPAPAATRAPAPRALPAAPESRP